MSELALAGEILLSGNLYFTPDPDRITTVPVENRTTAVPFENRTTAVPFENRITTVPED